MGAKKSVECEGVRKRELTDGKSRLGGSITAHSSALRQKTGGSSYRLLAKQFAKREELTAKDSTSQGDT